MNRESTIAERIAEEGIQLMNLPTFLKSGNVLNGFRISQYEKDGSFVVFYGTNRGYATFSTWDEVKADVLPWLEKQEKEAQKQLKDVGIVRTALTRR